MNKISSKLDTAEEKINEPEDIEIETIQSETQREKRLKNEQNCEEWDNFPWTNSSNWSPKEKKDR